MHQEKDDLLLKGLIVRVFYYDGKASQTLMGRIKAISAQEIVITTPQNVDVLISFQQVEKIDFYDKKLDVVLTVWFVAFSGIVILWLIAPFLIAKALGDKFENLNIDRQGDMINIKK